ncbi:type II toxin-antitoxin system Phd/YefM family antitoxin [Bailinhaonella thermotolerans]|uniref:Type II toxin-antitoxin system prevent-host-death family antitoxin n=1 Tax=Bailinhaonella thermotolerans TaxID=1070861 RepID=A0A3A3ZYS7_9ACTN|nr:type II toxin-antitoxin system prevent-host-death family antitoxin [Bailinhaonella thermotolerans]RJL19241.1 type II toxin-antitoxin system prevent-host-death family antitoxin [Bailinhaonella thermotolerans]
MGDAHDAAGDGPVTEVRTSDLRNDMAGYLARVTRGERLAVTARGKRIAMLIPATPPPRVETVGAVAVAEVPKGRAAHVHRVKLLRALEAATAVKYLGVTPAPLRQYVVALPGRPTRKRNLTKHEVTAYAAAWADAMRARGRPLEEVEELLRDR